jgi:macrolide transport system ATP-binding/permease protein
MFSSLIAGLRSLFRRDRRNAEIASELASFLEESVQEKMRRSLSRDQALRAARAEIGSAETIRHKVWSAGWESTAESAIQDLRFALRQLRKNPGFATTAILILTLGIAAAIAIFSFVDAALIQPLPYRDPSRLVVLYESVPLGPRFHLSYLDYLDWKRQNTVFSSLDVYAPYGFLLQTPTGTQRADGASVSAGFFRTLGVTLVLGRDFRPGDDQVNAPRPILLSYSAWQRRFGGRRDVLGQTVTLDGKPNNIIGVLPSSFHFAPAEPVDFWATERADGSCEKDRGCHNLFGVARLKTGVTFATAFADIKTIADNLARQFPDSNRDQKAFMLPLTDVIVGDVRPILLVLIAGAALLLLIAAVNVASLLLVRAEQRRREMAVRGALGASRSRLVRQFITEGVILAAISGVLGLALAAVVMNLFLRLIPRDIFVTMPYLRLVGVNNQVLLFAALVSVTAGILFSLLPALRVSVSDLRESLTEGGRSASGTFWRRFGSNLVVLELAMAVVLLTGAGLLGKSFYRLLHVDTGIEPSHLALLEVAATGPAYGKNAQLIALERQLQSTLSALPGVQSVAFTSHLPLGDGDVTTGFSIVGVPADNVHREVAFRNVSPNYFSTLQARIIRGRWFTDADDASHPPVVIINKQMAREYFPGQNPVGKQIATLGVNKMEVIAVINDLQEGQLDAAPRGAMYFSWSQFPTNFFAILIRASQNEDALLGPAAVAIHSVDHGLAISHPITMTERIHDSPSAALHRSSAWVVGGFAALALLLSSVGLYGVIAYSVSRRTREIGVRMALGAQRSSVYRLVLSEAGKLAIFGIVVGLLSSLAATMLLRSLLFRVQSWDVSTLAAVAFVLAASTVLASFIPARRAASVNPTEALRAE